MWSCTRDLLLGLLAASSVAAELSFVAKAYREDTSADISSALDFVPVPPRQRWRHGSRYRSNARGKRDPVSYSGNWCGASQHTDPAADPIVNAFSFFTAPDLRLRDKIPPPQFAAAWVGIDGASCKSALLQAGVTTIVSRCRSPSIAAYFCPVAASSG